MWSNCQVQWRRRSISMWFGWNIGTCSWHSNDSQILRATDTNDQTRWSGCQVQWRRHWESMWFGSRIDPCSYSIVITIIVKKTRFTEPRSVKVWIIANWNACESLTITAGEAPWARYNPTITTHNQKILVESTNPQRRPREQWRAELACRSLQQLNISRASCTRKVTGQSGELYQSNANVSRWLNRRTVKSGIRAHFIKHVRWRVNSIVVRKLSLFIIR